MVLNRGNRSLKVRASTWCDARQPVGGRRSLVEDPGRPACRLLQRPLEDPRVLPAGEYLVLQRGQVDLRGERLESTHRHSVAATRPGPRFASRSTANYPPVITHERDRACLLTPPICRCVPARSPGPTPSSRRSGPSSSPRPPACAPTWPRPPPTSPNASPTRSMTPATTGRRRDQGLRARARARPHPERPGPARSGRARAGPDRCGNIWSMRILRQADREGAPARVPAGDPVRGVQAAGGTPLSVPAARPAAAPGRPPARGGRVRPRR